MRFATPEYRLGALSFGVAIAFLPGIFSAPFMPRWWMIAIGLPLVSGFMPLQGNRLVGMLAVIGIVGAGAVTLYSEYIIGSALPFIFLALLIATGAIAAQITDLDPALYGFAGGVGVSALLVIAQTMGLVYLPTSGIPAGLFFNSEVMAELAAPLAVWAILKRNAAGYVMGGILLAAIGLCASRIAVATLMVGFLWALWPRNWAYRAALILGGLFLAVCALILLGDGKIASADHRVMLWATALQSLTIEGRSLGWWASAHPFAYEEVVHSDVLQLLVELGIFALPLLAIPVLILRHGISDIAQGGCFAALCFEAVVSFPLQLPASGFLFAMLTGYLAGHGYVVRRFELSGGNDCGDLGGWPSPNPARMARDGGCGGGSLSHRSTDTQGARAYPARGLQGYAINAGVT